MKAIIIIVKEIVILIFIVISFYGVYRLFMGSDFQGPAVSAETKSNYPLTEADQKLIRDKIKKQLPDINSSNSNTSTTQTTTPATPTTSDQQINQPTNTSPKSTGKQVDKQKEQDVKLQIIKAIITYDDGLLPTTFTLKKDIPARFEIDPKDTIDGCMSTILIPDLYEEPSLVEAGKKIIMEFTPTKTGAYYLTCVMGVDWGEIKIIE